MLLKREFSDGPVDFWILGEAFPERVQESVEHFFGVFAGSQKPLAQNNPIRAISIHPIVLGYQFADLFVHLGRPIREIVKPTHLFANKPNSDAVGKFLQRCINRL